MIRSAFSMLSAIVIMIIMGILLALVSSLSGKIVKETTFEYRHAQAKLLAKSYTNFALYAIQKRNQNKTCLRTITGKTGTYKEIKNGISYQIDTKLQYIGLKKICPKTNYSVYGHYSLGSQTRDKNTTENNDLFVTIDVYVMYHDTSVTDTLLSMEQNITNTTPWITYHKRTLHKLQ